MKNDLGLVPLLNFGEVIAEVYRSAQPEYDYQFNWLQKFLKVKTIINLRSESILTNRKASRLGINVIHIPVNDHEPPTDGQVDQFQSIVCTTTGPLLIHCAHGHGRTSTFSVLTKLSFGWSLESALRDEEERFHYMFNHCAQVDFLKNYQQAHPIAA